MTEASEEASGLFAGLSMAHSPQAKPKQADMNAVPASTLEDTKESVEISPVLESAPVTDKLLAKLTMASPPPVTAAKEHAKVHANGTSHETSLKEEQPPPAEDKNDGREKAPALDNVKRESAVSANKAEKKDVCQVAASVNELEKADDKKPAVSANDMEKKEAPSGNDVEKEDNRKPAAASASAANEQEKKDGMNPAASAPPKEKPEGDTKLPAKLSKKDRQRRADEQLEEAFEMNEEEYKTPTLGQVHPDTPIPNSDAALRLLRKFASKTRPQISVSHGGTKGRSMLGYLFRQKDDPMMYPYAQLMEILFADDVQEEEDEEDVVVESILGHAGDNMVKARQAVAAFCNTASLWCHASSRSLDDSKAILLGHAMDTATALVARGCMDNVMIAVGDEYNSAVQVLAESIFCADLSLESNELAALKFLLSTGCRSSDGQALLRGTHLLQSIRVLYHVYLTTDSKHNKTTARASLQQLVTSVFCRMIDTQKNGMGSDTKDGFASDDHRDAFLVLRTLCKLSMRTLPDTSKNGHTGGLQSSGSNTMWDGGYKESKPGDEHSESPAPQPHVTQAMNSALESKILALELLLYVLQNTDMSGGFLLHSGPQFQYAVRNYLCVSLLKNCTSDNTTVVNLSLRLFVPLIRNFRSHLKTEIEAFVTNVFFVILDSKNSTSEHKVRVAILFEEICSDPTTLAEIFLNYDCDLSAVDLFHRIVNTLSRVAKTEQPIKSHFVAGAGATRMEKMRKEQRELRLYAMRALKQVLASLHHSIVDFGNNSLKPADDVDESASETSSPIRSQAPSEGVASPASENGKQTLVQIYDSKKKRRQEESEAILRFNQKPSAGISYAAKCGHLDGESPVEVARYLLKNKDSLEKTQIGEYLGREAEYQGGFSLRVLHEYVKMLDFTGLEFDDAIRYYLSGFRLPGEAQKIDRIMEKFAERYTNQNPDVFPTADVAFILAFSIIMLNTDLHNPAIKEERRMTKEGFIRNNRGICDGQDLPEQLLMGIFDRIQADPISLKEDDEARERAGTSRNGSGMDATGIPSALSPGVFFSSHYDEMDRARETNFQKERDQIVRTTETLLRRKRHHSVDHGKSHVRHSYGKLRSSVKFVRTVDTGLRDEYVSPMFDVTWAPALAAFSTAMESANGTMGALLNIATDEELESAAENAAETTEVCLTGFRLAICTAGLCGNNTARDAFMLALVSFSQLGTGRLLEHRHVRCIQSLLTLGRDDGELLGNTWEHIFKALSEIHRFHEVFQMMARSDRAAAAKADRRRRRLEARERKQEERERRRLAAESQDLDSVNTDPTHDDSSDSEESLTDSEEFSDDDESYFYDTTMDKREVDEANARVIYDAIPESLIDAIYQRSSSLSGPAINDFIFQLCRVSRMEISGYGGHVGSDANAIDLTTVHYRQQHTLLNASGHGRNDQLHHNQPNIYNLQKLVEVTHYNMDSRPRLVFSEIWTTVAAHLTSTALHENPAVAMYAVDSFRQLSFQYLQREELGVFEFQSRFLKPLETVMARSRHDTTKELLLNCVERIILMFGSEAREEANLSPTRSNVSSRRLGTLRSGWRPVLAVLGIAGHDENENISKTGFDLLSEQLNRCLSVKKDSSDDEKAHVGILIEERFVDLVNAILMYVSGPHEEMSSIAIEHLVALSGFLADKDYALPIVRRRGTMIGAPALGRPSSPTPNGQEDEGNRELELWWPILLGLSRSLGDSRESVRRKSLASLFDVINEHFLASPSGGGEQMTEGDKGVIRIPRHGDLQTLQLIFRGILTPALENAASDVGTNSNPPVPDDFVRFITKPPVPPASDDASWLDTTFGPFMDGCVAVCNNSIEAFKNDALIEEVFAILNSCLLSDSGILAVQGLRRLLKFVTEDLDEDVVTDDTWATASHMLRRCLLVRGLTTSVLKNKSSMTATGENVEECNEEVVEAMNEFLAEEQLFADRRYIGSNATMVIQTLVINDEVAPTLASRWRLFLIKGLGRAVKEWELAAGLLDSYLTTNGSENGRNHSPPHYLENALFGRKVINRFLLTSESMNEGQASRSDAAQSLLEEETLSLMSAYLEQEKSRSRSQGDLNYLKNLSMLSKEMLTWYGNLEEERLIQMTWLAPLLSTCIQAQDPTMRQAIQTIMDRLLKGNTAGPSAPDKSTQKAECSTEVEEQADDTD